MPQELVNACSCRGAEYGLVISNLLGAGPSDILICSPALVLYKVKVVRYSIRVKGILGCCTTELYNMKGRLCTYETSLKRSNRCLGHGRHFECAYWSGTRTQCCGHLWLSVRIYSTHYYELDETAKKRYREKLGVCVPIVSLGFLWIVSADRDRRSRAYGTPNLTKLLSLPDGLRSRINDFYYYYSSRLDRFKST